MYMYMYRYCISPGRRPGRSRRRHLTCTHAANDPFPLFTMFDDGVRCLEIPDTQPSRHQGVVVTLPAGIGQNGQDPITEIVGALAVDIGCHPEDQAPCKAHT